MDKAFLLAVVVFMIVGCQSEPAVDKKGILDYVDPFIGTDGKGKTYPGATVPFGMIQLSPDNGRNGWDWISGYFYPDTLIAGFSHLHLSGTGAGDLYDISFLPFSGAGKRARLDTINKQPTVYSTFSHDNESASPGYYQVYLDDYDVNVELTASNRAGYQRYTYEGEQSKVFLNLGYSRNWDKTEEALLYALNDSVVVGHRFSSGWAPFQTTYFVSVFSEPIKRMSYFKNGEKQEELKLQGKDIYAIFDFDGVSQLQIKTAISSVSIDRAIQNLLAEPEGFDFDKIKSAAEFDWQVQLGKVDIKAGEEEKIKFYTSMYHSLLAPTLFSDVDGGYRGTDRKLYYAEDYKRYSTFSLWDTYRALHPWLTITQPAKVVDMMKSLMAFYQESGELPVWTMQATETDMMIGYHAIPVLTDALLKGLTTDTLNVYEAMKVSAMQDDRGLTELRALEYIPYESGGWSVSRTMEYAYDDWCIAQIAKLLKEDDDYDYFQKRSQNYVNHYDSESGFFRAKSTEGGFREPFDPLAYHPEDYCEANALQYLWSVPHDIDGLLDMVGGYSAFESKLDDMFTIDQQEGKSPEWISGFIGQYVHGNEPSHHVPYLYQYVNAGHKTHKMVRQIMNELYSTAPDGLAGNEDCGQMSAWYLFSALGFYPVNPAIGEYVLGSPTVDEAIIHLPKGKKFKVIVVNQSDDNVYVRQVSLNGTILTEPFITHEQIIGGGELVFEMANNY